MIRSPPGTEPKFVWSQVQFLAGSWPITMRSNYHRKTVPGVIPGAVFCINAIEFFNPAKNNARLTFLCDTDIMRGQLFPSVICRESPIVETATSL